MAAAGICSTSTEETSSIQCCENTLDQVRMEQLILPMLTVSVDLVEGESLVREVGDATMSVLESINLPPLSLPIIKSGQALVDGGCSTTFPLTCW
jgi:NTE family protein